MQRYILMSAFGALVVLLLAGTALAAGSGGARTEDGDENTFGEIRSAEVERFGECMAAQHDDPDEEGVQADRSLCEDLLPQPAWQNPDHPVFGEGGIKAGRTPPDDDSNGPPADTGRG